MIDIVDRMRFDAVRCELQFSKGVAANLEEAAREIERLRDALTMIHEITKDPSVAAWQALQNVAATASSALTSKESQ